MQSNEKAMKEGSKVAYSAPMEDEVGTVWTIVEISLSENWALIKFNDLVDGFSALSMTRTANLSDLRLA